LDRLRLWSHFQGAPLFGRSFNEALAVAGADATGDIGHWRSVYQDMLMKSWEDTQRKLDRNPQDEAALKLMELLKRAITG
jgi:membrane-associated protease RseP (regulator of RpoE activity)